MRYLLWSVVLATMLTAVVVISRPILPVDETRYLSVAWEAHQRGDYLVSHLNGEPYSHKPPLLFWLINVVWFVTGVDELAGRLVAPASGLMCLVLTFLMTRRLWPQNLQVIQLAPVVHVSLMLWIVFCPLTMFDTLLTCCSLCSLLGLLYASEGKTYPGWLLAGCGMGLGILTKGPVVLVHVLPAALMAPWWSSTVRSRISRWYAGLLVAILLAVAIGLAWALPSAAAGGAKYSNELLFGQTAGRMVNSFAHRQPFWWYLPWLPLCLMPWISFGAVWRGFRLTAFDSGMRFLVCCAGGSLLILTLVSGKQIYYLLPMFPPCAIILARIMTSVDNVGRRDLAFIAPGTIGMAWLPTVFNSIPELTKARLTGVLDNSYAIPLGLCGALLLVPAWKKVSSLVLAVATSSVVFISIVVWGISGSLWDGFNLKPIAHFTAGCSRPVAWLGDYHGQLNFIGEIPSIDETFNTEALEHWLVKNPEGAVIVRLSEANPAWQSLKEPLDAVDRTEPSGEQKQLISDLLSSHPEFPLARLKPEILFAQKIRRGLTFDLTVIVSYRDATSLPQQN